MNKLMRRPRPDFTTAFATRKAITTNRTLALANPPNAFAGGTVPVRTAAPTASVVAASRGNAPTNTDAIAETNTANKCQAGAVNPSGTGVNQSRSPAQTEMLASTSVADCSPRRISRAGSARPPAGPHLTLQVHGLTLHRVAVLVLKQETPREFVGAGHAYVTARAVEERSEDPIAR